MEIKTIGPFLDYYERIRERTMNVVRCIPPDKIEWRYKEGKFSFADMLRHLAAIERYVYAETVQLRPSRYPGHGKELADGHEAIMEFLTTSHKGSMEIFRQLSDDDLQRKCLTAAGNRITVWKWLRAMVEHEVHHRGQLYMYLAMLDIPTPPLYGLTAEEVQARSSAS